MRPKERRQTDKRMRESEVRQEIIRDRRGLVGKAELTSEVQGAAHLKDRTVRESERNEG